MNPAPEAAYIAFEGAPLHRIRRSARGRPLGQAGARPAAACLDPDLRRQRPARWSISIFAARSTMSWRGFRCRNQQPTAEETAVAAAARAAAGRNSAWSRAKSRCCRGIGNGWRSNRAALRSRCANWSTKRAAPTRTAIAFASRRKPPIASCRPWPATGRISRKRSRALFAGDADRFEQLIAEWPADVRDHAARLAAPAFQPRSLRRSPVDPPRLTR